MIRTPYLLFASLFALPAMAQTVVTKSDGSASMSSAISVTHITLEAIPIHTSEGIPAELQVPKEAITQQAGEQTGHKTRPAPIHISLDAVLVVPGNTLSPNIKEIVGGDGSSSRPGETIVLPPMPAIHVGTIGLPPRPEVPLE